MCAQLVDLNPAEGMMFGESTSTSLTHSLMPGLLSEPRVWGEIQNRRSTDILLPRWFVSMQRSPPDSEKFGITYKLIEIDLLFHLNSTLPLVSRKMCLVSNHIEMNLQNGVIKKETKKESPNRNAKLHQNGIIKTEPGSLCSNGTSIRLFFGGSTFAGFDSREAQNFSSDGTKPLRAISTFAGFNGREDQILFPNGGLAYGFSSAAILSRVSTVARLKT